jgi:hypothetical protein
MQLILAIDSDPRRSEQLANLVRSRLQVEFVQATSAGEGLHALRDRVPDLILTSPLLSPFDDGVLDEYLRDLGAAATHVQTLRIPMLSTGPKKKSAANRLFSLGRKQAPTSSAAPDGCDPKVFADEIAHYLTRSLEERSAFGRNDFAKDDPSRMMEIEPEPVDQTAYDAFARGASAPEDWGAPEALVREFREMAPVATSAKASAPKAPETDYLETHVPGSILDLRTPIVHAPQPRVVEPEPVFVEPERFGFVEPQPPSIFDPKRHFDVGRHRSAFIEPEPPTYVEPEPPLYVEPEQPTYIEPEQSTYVEPERLTYVEPVRPTYVEPERPSYVEPERPTYVEQERFDRLESGPVAYLKEQTRQVFREREAPVHITPAAMSAPAKPATPVSTASSATASGNSASFEAALAAIRAAWAKPEPKTPAAAGAGSSAGVTKPGASEVDLTNQVDALEDVTDVDGSTPATTDDSDEPNGRRKVEKPRKRPENPRARKTRGADGRDDWGVLDPNRYGINNR